MSLDLGALNTDAINTIIPELQAQVKSEVTVDEELALWGGPEGAADALNAVFYRLQRALYGVEPVTGTPYDPEDVVSRIEDKLYFADISPN
jgi:hypothetical protein